ncbi:MAG: Do family serine endopeptidase [Acidobacteria bacterium]|nr:Do family serine endopeptidase [Acidobacteriota bacterium]
MPTSFESFLSKFRERKLLSTSLILFTLSIGILIGTLVSTGVKAARQQVAPDATPLTIPAPVQLSSSFAQIAKKVRPAVVNINTESVIKAPKAQQPRRRRAPSDDEEDPGGDMFRRFFGRPFDFFGNPFDMPQGDQKVRSLGSGIVVDPNGYILTNRHVVEEADRIRVKLMDDPTLYNAKLIGADIETDLAVIKIDAKKALTYAKIGNSDAVEVGDWAMAIGSPFGFDETVTAGIISAKGREIPQGGARRQFQRFIQTDAAINRGNSGGPLLNINGEVVGINTAIVSSSGGYEGLGFAMPSNVAVGVYNQLIKEGKVVRGSIGISFRDQNESLLRVYGAKEGGVLVNEVQPGGPAEKAGVKPEDLIVALDGKPVHNGEELVDVVANSPVGRKLKLSIMRDGKAIEIPVAIADRTQVFPELTAENREEQGEEKQGTEVMFGISVSNITAEQRKQWDLNEPGGVAVTNVEASSFADDIGLAKNDVVLSINRRSVQNVQDVRQIQRELKAGSDVAFRVLRRVPTGRQLQWRSIFLAGVLPSGQ